MTAKIEKDAAQYGRLHEENLAFENPDGSVMITTTDAPPESFEVTMNDSFEGLRQM